MSFIYKILNLFWVFWAQLRVDFQHLKNECLVLIYFDPNYIFFAN